MIYRDFLCLYLESHSTTDAIGAFETSHFTRLDARLIARQTPTIAAAAVLGVQQRRCRRRRPTTPSTNKLITLLLLSISTHLFTLLNSTN